MRFKRSFLLASLAGVATLSLAIGVSGTALARTHAGTTCTYLLENSAGTTSGTMTGAATCPKPVGPGSASFAYTLSTSKGKTTYAGTFNQRFRHEGHLIGTFTMTGSKGSGKPLSGTFKITKGTRKLAKATGASGTLNCTSTTHGATYKCTAVVTSGQL